ncbi:MAG: glycosyltransferase family 4 protein [Pseudolabrys sp.]|nr:glycosyltransferase family 4 protein [Pseudolabrys sp.]MDP2298010.1 glycosyltransferase family 4 protein [Pseudolabrys sp.]
MNSLRPAQAPVLLYLVTEDWYFLSHRLPMALAAQRAGYEVHVATHVGAGGDRIKALGFHLHPLAWRRGSVNPLDLIAIVREVRALYRRLSPDLAHHVALQPSVVGSLAAWGLPITQLNAFAGLGSTFTSQSLKSRIVRPVLKTLLRLILNRRRSAALVQNGDDRDAITAIGVDAARVFLIPGSGVDVDVLTPMPEPMPEPEGEVTLGYVGRLLEDKGLRTLIAAHDLLTQRGVPTRLLIAGQTDPANPASIVDAEIQSWKRKPNVTLLGHVNDVREVWAKAHIAVLPSRREGLPKSLLEAAACGRPMIASDVPGCREIARNGVNGLLVPPDDAPALAAAVEQLARDPALRRQYGAAGRHLVETEFSSALIGRKTVALYDGLLGRALAGAAY